MKIDPDEGVYVISVVSKIIGVPPRTLRKYDRKGILSPKRTPTNQRLYSQKDVEKLNFLAYLANVKRVNVAVSRFFCGVGCFLQAYGKLSESLSMSRKRYVGK